ncbi:YggS family pyridoxal phosphate-dependent enzyme [Trichlorobacter ammonificans]|uniref:Pyridoxal phosphate homeostasis protein n=1 Tax=Trichlorobacter ammonificans TaxID=2916410 RepID=A0ABM9D6E9_9BACT|nr:YggS family pyridoxal phosphate-dependent enzyme [Trichlorobacter ammonificans]CAH2030302.1 Pyridoxal phosphate homeostasis protein [Trichlorobacter ammonificans]
MSVIAEHLATVRHRIAAACGRCGRDPRTVELVAVSKTRPAEDVREAFRAGQRIFGENYVQELVAKAADLHEPVEWHVIGHLQSNKVRQIAGLTSLIHSVDRLSLARELSRQWGRLEKVCNLLVQVNVSGEASKSGTTAAEALALVREIARLPHLRVQGLMTMPPFFDDPEEARPYFRELRLLADRIREEAIPGVAMERLSMGMSGDFEVAVEEGATLVRVGTAIFGER